jgi:hypothetical protein
MSTIARLNLAGSSMKGSCPDYHPLVDAAQSAMADLGDAFRRDPARGRAKW